MVTIGKQIILVGGFYHGILQVIFCSEPKYNGSVQIDAATITSLSFSDDYDYLYLGDSEGMLGIYRIHITPEHIDF